MSTPTQPTPREAITAAMVGLGRLNDFQRALMLGYLLTDLRGWCIIGEPLSPHTIACAIDCAAAYAARQPKGTP